jgi:hypothetical protein
MYLYTEYFFLYFFREYAKMAYHIFIEEESLITRMPHPNANTWDDSTTHWILNSEAVEYQTPLQRHYLRVSSRHGISTYDIITSNLKFSPGGLRYTIPLVTSEPRITWTILFCWNTNICDHGSLQDGISKTLNWQSSRAYKCDWSKFAV